MQKRLLLIIAALSILSSICDAQASPSDYRSGFYIGLEGGIISYNTQITFDGVDDPAGRSGAGYGAMLGYSHVKNQWLIGAEMVVNFASVPNPYTFDPAVTGFSELDLRRGASIGLDARVGYVIAGKVLLYGSVGYSANKQSVRIDGVSLNLFPGGAADAEFAAFQSGIGTEIAVRRNLAFRFTFRSLAGHDLSASDFGSIPRDASLTRLDVEPKQQQFFWGLVYCF